MENLETSKDLLYSDHLAWESKYNLNNIKPICYSDTVYKTTLTGRLKDLRSLQYSLLFYGSVFCIAILVMLLIDAFGWLRTNTTTAVIDVLQWSLISLGVFKIVWVVKGFYPSKLKVTKAKKLVRTLNKGDYTSILEALRVGRCHIYSTVDKRSKGTINVDEVKIDVLMYDVEEKFICKLFFCSGGLSFLLNCLFELDNTLIVPVNLIGGKQVYYFYEGQIKSM